MRKTKSVIPNNLRQEIDRDPFYSSCSLLGRHGHICAGRITREHAINASGKNVQNKWSIIPLCAKGHDVDQFQDSHSMVKELNEWVALSRASVQDILDLFEETGFELIKKADILLKHRAYLIGKYGEYKQKVVSINYHGIPMMEKTYGK